MAMETPNLSPNLTSLSDFMDIVLAYVPRGKRIVKIYELHPHPEKLARCYAQISTSNDREYSIGLYRTYYRLDHLRPLKRTLKEFSTLDTLMHLAHEISHLVEWEHTPYRQVLECRIGVELMERAIELGYVSEEKELGRRVDRKKCYSLSK
jgi:hypothetical protein